MELLHKYIITGPIRSRRLGLSLGVNLLPVTQKICNYDCVYCECGWDTQWEADPRVLPSIGEVEGHLRMALRKLKASDRRPDSVTFSGNGEPTLHPDFGNIVLATERCVREVFPENTPWITVISNATQIGRADVREALSHCTKVLLKLDAGTPQMYARINRLQKGFRLGDYRETMAPEDFYNCLTTHLAGFPFPFFIQTLLFRGECDGLEIDNTAGDEWEAYVEQLRRIHPHGVMLYGLDRETPAKALQKLSREELETKAAELEKAGIENVTTYF